MAFSLKKKIKTCGFHIIFQLEKMAQNFFKLKIKLRLALTKKLGKHDVS